MFWGEAQLQTMIDRGVSPLPVFGDADGPTAAFVVHAYCMTDGTDEGNHAGFSTGCSLSIAAFKLLAIGLSVGTGIFGGQFWGPLFVGCATAHVFTAVANDISGMIGFGKSLGAYPVLTILCVMGGAHVVTFRAWMAITLILTLTIRSFGGNATMAGDYAAVLPLLVVAVVMAMMVSQGTIFYKAQRSRKDIVAVPEVLCEPHKNGKPLVVGYDGVSDDDTWSISSSSDHEDGGTIKSPQGAHARQKSMSSYSRRILRQVATYGEVSEEQPCLLEQARMQSASSVFVLDV